MRDVEEFAHEYSLQDIAPLLKKGALVAQNPGEFENVEGLEEDEKEALRDEVIHKWRQPKALYFTVVLCSIGAAVQVRTQAAWRLMKTYRTLANPHTVGLGSNRKQRGQSLFSKGVWHR